MISSLTSFRFFAALLIFIYHYRAIFPQFHFYGFPLDEIIQNIGAYGDSWVVFFFVLSGFVLAFSYKKRFISDEVSTNHFFIGRLARIYPLHLLTFMFSIPLMAESPWSSFFYQSMPFNLLLIHSFIPDPNYYYSFNSPSWCISNLIFFYALFPLLIRLRRRFLILIILTIISFPFAVKLYAFKGLFLGEKILDRYFLWIFYISPFFRLADFISGILLFEIFNLFSLHKLNYNFIFASFFEIFAIILLFSFFYYANYIPKFLLKDIYFLFPMVVFILIISLQSGLFSKILSSYTFVYLGELSYPFYMLHQLVLRYLLESQYSNFFIRNSTVGFMIAFSFCLFLSAVSLKFFERPMSKIIKYKILPLLYK